MSKTNSSTLKKFFQTGTIPTQDHFGALIDSALNLVDANMNVDERQQLGIGCVPSATLSVQSQYNQPLTGTVSTTSGAATVLGTQTRFLSEAPAGTILRIAGADYTVTAVTSDTSLTIQPPFPPAPAPVVKNGVAWVDAGVSLLCADTTGKVALHLKADGSLHAQEIVATASVTAGAFVGDGAGLSNIAASALSGTLQAAQLPDIPMSKVSGTLPAGQISGTLNAAQLPPIPAAQISGVLSPAQIPSLTNRQVLLYAPVPVIPGGTRASICWQADPAYTLSLAYQQNGRYFQITPAPGPGQYRSLISQRTLFTLTAMAAGQLLAQHQVWVDTY